MRYPSMRVVWKLYETELPVLSALCSEKISSNGKRPESDQDKRSRGFDIY
jgi:hypothetical protein